jgi:hypothetical protein
MSAGIEIEYGSFYEWDGCCDEGDDDYYDDDCIPYDLDRYREEAGADWCHKTDCSVDIGNWGLESASKIYPTVAELEVETLRFARAMGSRFDTDDGDSAGIHIHIGIKKLSTAIAVYDRVNSIHENDMRDLFGRDDGEYHYASEPDGSLCNYKFQRSAIRREFGTYEMRMFASTFSTSQLREYFLFAKYVEHMFKTNYVPTRQNFIKCFTRFKEKVCALQS